MRTGRDPLTGTYGQLSRTCRGSRREASGALARLVTEVRDGRYDRTHTTVRVLLEHWLEQDLETQGRAVTTIEGYSSLVRARLEPGLGSIQLDRLSPAGFDRFYRALLEDGLSRMSIRHCHAALSTSLRQAVK